MDYRALLKKYIRMVVWAEGISFIPGEHQNGEYERERFGLSEEELAELRALDKETENEPE